MSTHACFMLEELPRARRSLRVYHWGEGPAAQACEKSGYGYHEALVAFDEVEQPLRTNYKDDPAQTLPWNDARWPKACPCGYEFQYEDQRRIFIETLYRCSDTEAVVTLREARIGAIWEAWWYSDDSWVTGDKPMFRRGPDGKVLEVRTPGGDWCVDQVSSQGSFWQRSGDVPLVTVTPSILMGAPGAPRYHGYLTNGILGSTPDSPT